MHEGAVVAAGQWDLLVAELQLQAAVEEAEQDVVGQAEGAVTVLSVLCPRAKTNAETQTQFVLSPELQHKKNAFNCSGLLTV